MTDNKDQFPSDDDLMDMLRESFRKEEGPMVTIEMPARLMPIFTQVLFSAIASPDFRSQVTGIPSPDMVAAVITHAQQCPNGCREDMQNALKAAEEEKAKVARETGAEFKTLGFYV